MMRMIVPIAAALVTCGCSQGSLPDKMIDSAQRIGHRATDTAVRAVEGLADRVFAEVDEQIRALSPQSQTQRPDQRLRNQYERDQGDTTLVSMARSFRRGTTTRSEVERELGPPLDEEPGQVPGYARVTYAEDGNVVKLDYDGEGILVGRRVIEAASSVPGVRRTAM